ncbi:redoxin domain-containing protein [Plantibacter sp. YIM 135249]|uniref:redoxin domain-containing protein n=1 Tax=Plantibacter sp. YIM 135249 TaxID=3423918 RepID=UPI003D345597
MTLVRIGEAFEFEEQLTVEGGRLSVGGLAPEFVLEQFDPEKGAIRPREVWGETAEVRILNVINAVDTPVCSTSLTAWESHTAALKGVTVVTISMDLPFTLERARVDRGLTQTMLSSHKNEAFATAYGIHLREWRMLQRAVFVIDQDGKLLHVEYIADQMAEPNYQAAVDIARRSL